MIALVTGGNRGIGFEICRQLGNKKITVYLGARDKQKGIEAAERLIKEGLTIKPIVLDTSDEKSIESAFQQIKKTEGKLDILVNNAGVYLDDMEVSSLDTDPKIITETFKTNTLGPFILCQKFIPLMLKNRFGRVVNMSSGMGQLDDMEGGSPGYRISKTALNAVTKIFAQETKDTDVYVNCMCPGWVKTEMGGPGADRNVEEGADTAVWLATLPPGSPSGFFFRDRKQIVW